MENVIDLLRWLFMTPVHEFTILHGVVFTLLVIGITFPILVLVETRKK